MPEPRETAVYTHGHHESVLRSHTWRTAANSAAYLLPSLKPHMKILDIGCGPGTITADLAALVPDGQVTGVDRVPGILKKYGGRVLARGGRFKILEGPQKFHRFVVIEFPSLEQGVAGHDSPEYREAAAFRRSGAGEVELVIVEGGDAT